MNVLSILQAREFAGKFAGKILNVPEMYWVGTCLVLCPFPCNVLVMYWLSTLVFVPSVRIFKSSSGGSHLPILGVRGEPEGPSYAGSGQRDV